MRSLLRRTEIFALRTIAFPLLIAAIATPTPGMSQVANPDKPGLANVMEIPANVAIVLLRTVTQKDEYALRLADEANNTVENLPLTDRGSAKVCVRAQTTPRKLKVVGVSLPDQRLLAAIVRWEPDSHVYHIALWDQSTPHTVRVVATAKLALSGATSDSCGNPG